ncbi:hypothetical protein EDD16DRAFT_291439 [Pisolithus croceorrhizus]|nr:hypothetical protein EDD16DRAFT_291439 [Pisolithus croceorrhizus]KAI6115028.1 hypothetical protein EV401DRAFT_2090468 [Pisolithus croceorrhizus]
MVNHSLERSLGHSSIPTVTPYQSRSSISSGLPVSQVAFGHQPRRTSESSSQASSASTSATLGPQTPQSSIPSFRSLRNLLPFGSGKNSNSNTPSPNTPKPHFVDSLRRSINHERKTSIALTHPDDSEKFPVISIAPASQNFEEEMMARKRSRDLARSASDPTTPYRPPATGDDDRYVLPAPSPVSPLGADLSTIIEADNSGISKHIPCFDETASPDDRTSSPGSPFCLDKHDKDQFLSPDSRDASLLDLSTSKLNAEVMDALTEKDAITASEWLRAAGGIVVEERADDTVRDMQVPKEDPDATLDFDVLDPNLARLLSPHTLNGKPHRLVSPSNLKPPRVHSRSPSSPVAQSPQVTPVAGRKIPTPSPRLGTVIPPSPASHALPQSSPQRRSASLSRSSPAKPAGSSLPRLTRAVTTAPSAACPAPKEAAGSPNLHGAPKKRHQPPSPLSSQAHPTSGTPPANSRTSTDIPSRRLLGTRLGLTNRHVSSYSPSSSRTDLRPAADDESPSSGSQVSSRTASDNYRQRTPGPSLDLGGPLDVNKRRRPHLFSTRKRSMSVEEARMSPPSSSSRVSPIRPSSSLSNRPPAMDLLGPRTAKAFAAAGLLDVDRDGTNGLGRYSSLRENNEREDRYVPSRMAFSEAASTCSWGRSGSISRVMTPSEGVTWAGSPTFSVPRTTFSGGSTAPTSVSASSSAHQAAIQLLKDKHELETEALLAALSDSQRTTKTLREENTQLRDRIQELEDELDALRDQLRRLANGVHPPRPASQAQFAKPTLDRKIGTQSPLLSGDISRRPAVQRSHSFLRPQSMNSVRSSIDLSTVKREDSPTRPSAFPDTLPRSTSQRRASIASSIFPALPNNMSLLMLEEAMHDHGILSSTSVSPSSPSRLSKHLNGSITNGHVNPPIPTPATPATTDFSMTEVPGSPTSLQLRPEHELHLGDMASLSLYPMSDDEGQAYDL